jgi:hypothetical protein
MCLPPHPLPPLRVEAVFGTSERGGEGVEIFKEAGGLRPPASLKPIPLPRPNAFPITPNSPGEGWGVGVQG